MASAIDFTSIDETFPVAGQDNESQGFRDNFTFIKQGLEVANSEITNLQEETVKLTGENTFVTGNKLIKANLLQTTEDTFGLTVSGSSANIDFQKGHYQSFVIGASTTLTLTNWPSGSKLSRIRVQIAHSGDDTSTRTVIFNSQGGVSIKYDSSTPSSITVNGSNPTYKIFDFWTSNGGATVFGQFLGEFDVPNPNLTVSEDLTVNGDTNLQLANIASLNVSGSSSLGNGSTDTTTVTGLSVFNIPSNGATRFNILEGANSYLKIDTTTSSEKITFGTVPTVFISNTTDASSKDTGALVVDGGVGIEKALVVGTSLSVAGDTTLTGDLAVNGADITTSAASFNLLNATATTVNAFGAATAITVGASNSGTLTLRNSTVSVTNDLAVNGGDITTTATTFNLLNATATTVNAFGAGTTIGIGAATGTLTLKNANVVLDGDLQVKGGDVTTTATTFNLLNATATTVNAFGAGTTISIGSADSGTTTINHNLTVSKGATFGTANIVSGQTVTFNAVPRLPNFTSTQRDALALTLGSNYGCMIYNTTTAKTQVWVFPGSWADLH